MNYDLWKTTDRSRDAADALYEAAKEWAEDRPELAAMPDRYIVTMYLDFQEALLDQEIDNKRKEERDL